MIVTKLKLLKMSDFLNSPQKKGILLKLTTKSMVLNFKKFSN